MLGTRKSDDFFDRGAFDHLIDHFMNDYVVAFQRYCTEAERLISEKLGSTEKAMESNKLGRIQRLSFADSHPLCIEHGIREQVLLDGEVITEFRWEYRHNKGSLVGAFVKKISWIQNVITGHCLDPKVTRCHAKSMSAAPDLILARK